MKKILHYLSLVIVLAMVGWCESSDYDKVGYAPPEAFEAGSKYPYYGSYTERGFIESAFTADIQTLYKRFGQQQILEIVRGKPEEAVRHCRIRLAENPDDPEFLYALSVAQCQLGDVKSAIQTMKEALSNGFPFERFLAGPRNLLRPLTETEAFQEVAARYGRQLIHGPLLGCVTNRSAKFWVRTVSESPMQVRVSRFKNLARPIESEVQITDSNQDYTTVVGVSGLQPATTYYYDLTIDGKSELGPAYPSFRTYPSGGETARFQVVFGGGAGYVPPHERMWDVINRHHPLAFLLLGDNVYLDMPEAVHGGHDYTYYRRQSRPEFRRLTSSTSIYSIWDDHDCATNDVFMGPYKDKPGWKMSLFHLFQRNWNNPAYGDSEWPGTWFRFHIADVDFFMLDGRFYRTNPHADNPTMLGPVQKAWLLNQLKSSEATFKVIVSPVPWSFDAKGESLDTWNGYRQERDEIFQFLSDNKLDGVVLLSADRHRSDAWRIERPDGYALYEFESSRLTNEHVHQIMPGSIFGYNENQSFGLLTFDTTRPDPRITYQIYSIDDDLIYTLEVKRSEISHP